MKRLKDIFIDRIDVVDKGDNKRANILLFKNEGGQEVINNEDKLQEKGVEKMTYEELIKSMPEDQAVLITDAVAVKDAEIAKLADELEKAKKKDTAMPFDETNPVPQEEEDDMAKASPVIKAMIEQLTKEKDDAKAEIAKRDEELAKAAVEKRQSEFVKRFEKFDKIAAAPDELGGLMLKVADGKTTEEDVVKLEAILSAATEAIETGVVFKEVGTNKEGDVEETTIEKMEEDAKKLAKEKGTTKEIEFRNLIKAKPDVYKRYEEEKQKGV